MICKIYFDCYDDSKLGLLRDCFNDIKNWANKNFLKLNDNKTKFLIVSSEHKINSLSTNLFKHFSMETQVKNLGFNN